MIFVEPTPYIEAFVRACGVAWHGDIDVLYLSENASQSWGLACTNATILPRSRLAALGVVRRSLAASPSDTILHLAGWGHYVLAGAAALARVRGIPIAVESDTSTAQAAAGLQRIVKKLTYPALMRLPTLFFPGGTRQARYLSSLGVPAAKMTIAQMTVDVTAIRRFREEHGGNARRSFRLRYGISQSANIVLFLARIEPHKGIFDLIDAFTRYVHTNRNVGLVIAGDGSGREAAESRCKSDPRIIFTGRLTGDEVWAAYCAADIFVAPSRFEPWGLTVNEAMAAGLPVVASDRVGCVDDLVHHWRTGLVVAAGAAAALGEAIKLLLENPAVCAQLGRAGSALIGSWKIEDEARIVTQAWRRLSA